MKPALKIGTPGYYSIGTDTYPVTLVGTKGKVWQIRMEKFVGDMQAGHNWFGNQIWIITNNPKGQIIDITWREGNKIFRPKGTCCGAVVFGKWIAKQDPSF
jgi:hypothetical protein